MCESGFKSAGERHGMCESGFNTAGERHGMCESAFTLLSIRGVGWAKGTKIIVTAVNAP
jgi:hypothetical protein